VADSFTATVLTPDSFAIWIEAQAREGARFASLLALRSGHETPLFGILSSAGRYNIAKCELGHGETPYPSLGSVTPVADWYERRIFDLFGLSSTGNSKDPLILQRDVKRSARSKYTGKPTNQRRNGSNPSVTGEGIFKIPLGPVRSGVFESIEYVVETPGEEILNVEPRPFYKHRGVVLGFAERSVEDGALLAERAEGVSGVAHAIAYCQAIEALSEPEVPVQAQLVRVIHAELERVANHLESTMRHCEAAAQAVALSRLGLHKEQVMRLRADLCGHRFSRGVVSPGGVRVPLLLDTAVTSDRISNLEREIDRDLTLLLKTPSFVDRLRGTGVVTYDQARLFGALGPVGRGSGLTDDVRASHSYGAYRRLGFLPVRQISDGDALARQLVRVDEIEGSFHLLKQALDELSQMAPPAKGWLTEQKVVTDGESLGWAEAAQGEVLYLVAVEDGKLRSVDLRSASFHNMALFSTAFPKDIATDFAFIEASFGLSVAGVSS
jgi:Ni,Fe-hydrogenase III large subunit